MKRIITIVYCLTISMQLSGQDLESLIGIGLENNPEIKKFEARYEITAEKVNEVNSIPNTEFSYGYFVSEPETRTGAQKMKFSLKQMLPWFGSITARENYASSLSDAQYQEIVIAKRKLSMQISDSYYKLYALRAKDKFINKNIDLLKVYETLALSSVETGKASAVSVLRLQIRINELLELKELVNHKYKAEQAFLNGLLNRGPSEEIYLRDELPLPESDFEFESDKLQMHPELLKYEKLYASVEQEELLNQKDKSPMIGLGFDYIPVEKRPDMDFADNGKDIFMPMISLSIPIFNKKYKSSSKQHELMQIEINASKQNQFNKLQQMMDHAIHGRRAARATYNTQVSNLEHAKNAEEILMKGYESGNLDFIEILDVQELQLKFQLGQIEAIKDYYLQTSVINYLSS
ncbi:TolC family protein [Lutimonas saemankumensis]|uniref:TolC family protein n=1 Tax=Lutimonas saemankumensis TaxID=483016 RepID=UPI001CD30541|nr:TolC family protein [Lutimonas saemankumensis]MCA0931719.1 TolC family protein [Lutimonas saemankumensis]